MFSNKSKAQLRRLRIKLITVFIVVFGATLIIFSSLLYKKFTESHKQDFDNALLNYSIDVSRSVDVDLFGEVTLSKTVLQDSEKVFPFALGQTYIQLRTVSGLSIAKSRSLGVSALPYTPSDHDDLMSDNTLFRTIKAREALKLGLPSQNFRLITYLIDKPGNFDFVMQIAVPMVILDKEVRVMITFFGFSIPFILIAAGFGGFFISRSATRQIEQSLVSQEKFITDASHQLKTPLAILRGEIDLMRSKSRTEQELQEFLDSASQEVSHLSSMAENLLLLARTESGKSSLITQDVRVDEILLESVGRMEDYSKSHDIRLNVQFDESTSSMGENPYETHADPDLIRSLFTNLIENAIKYSPRGSEVRILLKPEARQFRISISDQGPGIPAESMPFIFSRFYRAESTGDRIPGSGLGLSIARQIAEIHGGRIEVESVPGSGSTFTIVLPKKEWRRE